MNGVIERKKWALYDPEGERMPLKSAGTRTCMVRRSGMNTRERLLRIRPYKYPSVVEGLFIARRNPKPAKAIDVSIRRCIITINAQEKA
jgi:hypothetical protein